MSSSLLRKLVAEHRAAALGLLFSRLVLNHIPVFDKNAVLDAKNIRCNPVHRLAEARKSSVHVLF